MAKLVARLLATAAHWVRIQTSLKKYLMGHIGKGVTSPLIVLYLCIASNCSSFRSF
jgi:hypothetical protein